MAVADADAADAGRAAMIARSRDRRRPKGTLDEVSDEAKAAMRWRQAVAAAAAEAAAASAAKRKAAFELQEAMRRIEEQMASMNLQVQRHASDRARVHDAEVLVAACAAGLRKGRCPAGARGGSRVCVPLPRTKPWPRVVTRCR